MEAATGPLAHEELSFHSVGPGRPILARPNGKIYVTRGYTIYSSDDDGASWSKLASIPTPIKRMPGRFMQLAARLVRFDVRALGVLDDGTLIAGTREGCYHSRPGHTTMTQSRVDGTGQPVMYPLTITVGPGRRVLWGEYNSATRHGNPVRLYASDDGGQSFEIAHVFEGGSILHVHNIVFDDARGHYWLYAGDFDHEPGVGILSADLKHFEWLVKGEQRFRLCNAFDFGDRLVYATDTPLERNAVMSLEKSSGKVERLTEVGGSSIYACQFGSLRVFSTTFEELSVEGSRRIELWVSRDGDRWTSVLESEKDRWHPHYFQFGSLILPRGESDRETIFFGGQAVKRYDGTTFAATLS